MNSTETMYDMICVPSEEYKRKIIMKGIIAEVMSYRGRDFRFWHLFCTAFEIVYMYHFFCGILSQWLLFSYQFYLSLWNSTEGTFLCPACLDHLVNIIMFIRSSKPLCVQDSLDVFIIFGRWPSVVITKVSDYFCQSISVYTSSACP